MYRLKKYINNISTTCAFNRITVYSFVVSAILVVLDYYTIL